MRPFALGDVLRYRSDSLHSGWPADRKIRNQEVSLSQTWRVGRQLEFDNAILLKTFIQLRLDRPLEHPWSQELRGEMTHNLFALRPAIIQVRLLRHHVPVVAIHHDDHFFEILHHLLVSAKAVRGRVGNARTRFGARLPRANFLSRHLGFQDNETRCAPDPAFLPGPQRASAGPGDGGEWPVLRGRFATART